MVRLLLYTGTRVATRFSGASVKVLLPLFFVGLTTHASSNQVLLACNLAKYNYARLVAFEAFASAQGLWYCGTPREQAYGDVKIACRKEDVRTLRIDLP